MNLPISINPNPLISSTIEIRFSARLNNEEVLPLFYPLLINSLSNFKEGNFQRETKKDKNKNIEFVRGYVFSNEDFQLSIGKNFIAFQNIPEYKLWSNYFPFVKRHIELISKLDIVESIERVGVRYVSILDGVNNSKDAINTRFDIGGIGDYETIRKNFGISLIKNNNVSIQVNITEGASYTSKDKTIKGLYVDIDASQHEDLPNSLNAKLIQIIEKLHYEEKFIFFNLLREDYLNKQNPIY